MSRSQYNTSIGGADKKFPATNWTLLLNPAQKEAILAELCEKYWKPLYCYLRITGFGNNEAKDLVQGFLTEKVISQELVQQADRTKGKLRTFLLTAIRNYSINVMKKERTHLELVEAEQYPKKQADPDAAFDRAWADESLQHVLDELRAECAERNKTIHWQLFREWLLEPNTDQQKSQMKDLCNKYGIENPAQAYHMIENIKRRFRSILREHMRDFVGSDMDIDAEIANFISIFEKDTARSG